MNIRIALALAALVTLAACEGSATAPATRDGASPSGTAANVAVVPFDLDVSLTGHGTGNITFRQYHDGGQLVLLGVAVHHLAPHTSYVLQRAVDALDGICNSTAWLTLGKGSTPATIDTDAAGGGHADLFRSLSAAPVGTTFDIRFRVLDAATLTNVVLGSDCYHFAIR